MTPTVVSTNEVLGLLWRVVMLDATAFQELRDTAHLTLIAAGGLVTAVVIAGLGAWLYSHTVLEGGNFSFVKTVLEFYDGEKIFGYSLDYDPNRKGFYLLPADPGDNNRKIFVLTSSLVNIQFLRE